MEDATSHELPLDGYRVELAGTRSFELSHVAAQVDGDDWDPSPIETVQARLEEEDDFAIVQLATSFGTDAALAGLVIDVTGEGLRNCTLDGTYMVPVKDGVPEDTARYQLPDPLPAGEHELIWSYAWSPPRDQSTGDALPGGVDLFAPRLVGVFADHGCRLASVPESVDLGKLAETGLSGGRVALTRTVSWPSAARVLHVEGPDAGVEVRVAGSPLSSERGGFVIPGAGGDEVELTLLLGPDLTDVRALRVTL